MRDFSRNSRGRAAILLVRLHSKGMGMKKTLLCATAAAALASVSSVAHADEGWYVHVDVGATIAAGFNFEATINSPSGIDGSGDAFDDTSINNISLTYGSGIGYEFGQGVRLELNVTARDVDIPGSAALQGDGDATTLSIVNPAAVSWAGSLTGPAS